jgi:hypothetical protein
MWRDRRLIRRISADSARRAHVFRVVRTRTRTRTHARSRTHARTRPHAHVDTDAHARTRTRARIHTRSHARARTHTTPHTHRTPTHARIRTHAHARTRTRTRTARVNARLWRESSAGRRRLVCSLATAAAVAATRREYASTPLDRVVHPFYRRTSASPALILSRSQRGLLLRASPRVGEVTDRPSALSVRHRANTIMPPLPHMLVRI